MVPPAYEPIVLIGFTVVMFACAVLCSTLLDRTLTAAAAGVALTLTLLSGLALASSVLSTSPILESRWPGFAMLALSAAILTASFAVFARAELFGASAGGGARAETAELAAR